MQNIRTTINTTYKTIKRERIMTINVTNLELARENVKRFNETNTVAKISEQYEEAIIDAKEDERERVIHLIASTLVDTVTDRQLERVQRVLIKAIRSVKSE